MSRPRILVLQNSVHAPAGLVGERLDLGDAEQEIRLALDGDGVPETTDGYDGLVVLGGPMNAMDDAQHPNLAEEARLVRQFIDAGLPILGICLGAQIMARASGAAVRQNATPEFGFTEIEALPAANDDPLLGSALPMARLMQWHYDTFDLPAGATLLASSRRCTNQAFRLSRGQYGFQFHLEVTPEIIRSWLEHFRANHSGEAGVDTDGIERQIESHMAAAAAFGRRIGDLWLAMAARVSAAA